ncbi:MAG: hypothetical protein REI12_02940 [Pedobacter sp.]|nr:hypothetical protein [Pedobacter sp.]
MSQQSTASELPVGNDLVWVDVLDETGHMILQHRYLTLGGGGGDQISTAQDPGLDGAWGTADDWVAAVTRCRYSNGGERSPVGFGLESFLGVSPSLCVSRHPLAGEIRAEMSGAYLSEEDLAHLRPATASAEDLEWIAANGLQSYLTTGALQPMLDKLNGAPVFEAFQLSSNASGLRFCGLTCVVVGQATSQKVACGSLCSAYLSPVADGISIGLDPNSCGQSLVPLYRGFRASVMRQEGRIDKVVYSAALNNPFCLVESYDRYRYDSSGLPTGVDSYDGMGADQIWLNEDDVLSAYSHVQTLSDSSMSDFYSGAGADGIWKTGDDVLAYWVQVQRDTEGRASIAKKCSEAGTDQVWHTADDACQQVVFHYGEPPIAL